MFRDTVSIFAWKSEESHKELSGYKLIFEPCTSRIQLRQSPLDKMLGITQRPKTDCK
jgi:hypothetical protein